MTDRGQSEVIGFLLVITVVLATMSIITVASLGELREIRNDERLSNAERAFDVLADNLDDLVEEGATSQATEINLQNARVAFGEPVTITVSGENTSNPDDNFSYTYSVRPIVYKSEAGGRIVYTSGATFREQRSGTVMLNEPSFMLSPDRSNVLVIQTRRTGRLSAAAGSSTALVRARRTASDLYRVNATSYDLEIEIDSPRARAWYRHLEEQPGTSCAAPAGGSVTCSLTTDRLYLPVVRVDVVIE